MTLAYLPSLSETRNTYGPSPQQISLERRMHDIQERLLFYSDVLKHLEDHPVHLRGLSVSLNEIADQLGKIVKQLEAPSER